MADLARRPRGGWQTGRLPKAGDGGPASLSDDDDVYGVERLDGESFIVRHYQGRQVRKVCCKVKVTITDRDRAQPTEYESPKGTTAALHRAYLAIEKKHAPKKE